MRNALASVTVRPGICDFVPVEDPGYLFASRNHPRLKKLQLALNQAGIQSLLDPQRLLALTELMLFSAERSSGDVIELGVYKGGSAAAVAWTLHEAGLARPLHLCDTFEGMPRTADWEFHKQHDFADTSFESVSQSLLRFLPNVPFYFHRGLFSQTLPALSDSRFCFAHIDADLYQSVWDACEFLYPRMAKGAIIVFDDYGAPTCPGAKKAIDEFFAKRIEKPTHVSMNSYAVSIGSEQFDFLRLLRRRTLLPAAIHGTYRAPLRAAARLLETGSRQLTSPRASKALAGPFFYAVRRQHEIGVRDARSMLVLRPDTLGDLVLMSPFLRQLRLFNPDAWITLVVDPSVLNAVELCPHVSEVLTFDHRQSGRIGPVQLHLRSTRFAREHFWQRKFDLALSPRWDIDYYHSSFLAYFSRASYRVGYSETVSPRKEEFNRGYDELFTRTIVDRIPKHEVERNVEFLKAVGGSTDGNDSLEMWLSEEDRTSAQKALVSKGVTGSDLIVGFGIGAGAARRIWPIGSFIELGRWLQRKFGVRIVIVGGPEDRVRGLRIQEELGLGAASFAGEMTLRQTGALLERAPLVIANDSGPMHLAAAAGGAVVEISCHPIQGDPLHANSPVRFRPWAKEYRVVQPQESAPPCTTACEWHDAHCINNVSVELVKTAVTGLIACLRSARS